MVPRSILHLLFLEKRAWLTHRRFHFPRRRVAGISLLPDAIFLAVSARISRLGRIERRGAFARSQPGKRKLARCVHRTLDSHIPTYSIVPCNSQEVHKPLVDFGMHTELYWNTPTSRLSCELPLFDYHLRIFQGETMSLGISCARFYIGTILFRHRKHTLKYKIIWNIFINFTYFSHNITHASACEKFVVRTTWKF